MSAVDVNVKFAADLSDVKAKLDGLQSHLKSWGDNVKKIGLVAFGSWVASKAFTSLMTIVNDLKSGMRDWISAASEAEDVDLRLALAVEQAGAKAGVTTEQLRALADQLEATTIFGDESIKMAETALLRFNLFGKTLVDATKASTQMASVLKQDVTQAAETVGRALAFPERALFMLRRAGIVLEPSQKKMIEGFIKSGETAKAQAAILDAITQKYGDAAAKIAGSYSGIRAQLANFAGDVEEALGKPLMELLKRVLPTLKEIVFHIKDVGEEFAKWLEVMMGTDEAKTGLDAINIVIVGMFADIETAIRRLPGLLKVAFAYIKSEIYDITAKLLEMAAKMPPWITGDFSGKLGGLAIGAYANKHAALGEMGRAQKELDARGTFGSEAAAIAAGIRDKFKAAQTPVEVAAAAAKAPVVPRWPGDPMAGTGSLGMMGGFGMSGMNMMMQIGSQITSSIQSAVDKAGAPITPFASSIEDAMSTFRRIATAAAGTPEDKSLKAQEEMLRSLVTQQQQDKDRNIILDKILKKNPVALAG